MQKFYFILFLLFFLSPIQSQTIVSTSPQNKNAIIEEFTDQNCQYCPATSKTLDQLIATNPSRIFGIALHPWSYSPTDPNYGTTQTKDIYQYFNITTWPSLIINRYNWGGGVYKVSSSNLSTKTQTILGQSAYLNVGIEAFLNQTSRQLRVHVEIYYTAKSPVSKNYLSVVLLQDLIPGPQDNPESYPEMYYNGTYHHNHMLRNMLTPTWGEEITTTSAGSFIDKNYYYTVPTSINNVAVDLNNLSVVAYVAETQTNIINGKGTKITFTTDIYQTNTEPNENINIFPNPSNNLLTISNIKPNSNIIFYNIIGEKIFNLTSSNTSETIDVKNIPQGTYIVKINNEGITTNRRIVITE